MLHGRLILLAALIGCATLIPAANAQVADLPPREPSPLSVRQIHSGHSLTDTYMSHPWPGRLVLATRATPGGEDAQDTIATSTIPGAPLHWRWRHEPGHGKPDARSDIGDYELLVTTEAVPLSPSPEDFAANTLDQIEKWVRNTWEHGNRGRGAEFMLYSTWVHWPTPEEGAAAAGGGLPFRRQLEREGKKWERMQDHANAVRPAGMPPVYMIPGHRLMMRIHDDIRTGRAPDLDHISDIFADDIHPNDMGRYAVTCLVYAVIYQRDPRSLPDKLADPEDTLSTAQARYFKETAWEVARNYDRAGLR
ncbi:hypothetical protein [Roseovarius salinarum]|uniref:hypothetical protein n=1 Tax=Roseovarius salinarum TaxID=1981892 RepID=UPI0012FFE1B1|nr:hypothetical protein [Roseovarius salinarum]